MASSDHAIRVMISDDQTRDVVVAALLREMADVVSGGVFNGALTDDAWECSERIVDAGAVDAAFAQFDARFGRIVALRADIDEVRGVAAGDNVGLSLGRTQFSTQVRDIIRSIQEDERFWERDELRQRNISIYDAAWMLAEEFPSPVEGPEAVA